MKQKLTSADAQFYREHGYIVLRQLIPPALITDLRRTADQALAVARRLHGPQTQRLGAIGTHAEVNVAAAQAFLDLPELRAALDTVLSPVHRLVRTNEMTILFEPAEQCWATEWHRDWRDHMSAERFQTLVGADTLAAATNPNFFNQVNCALYEDTSTWYVPGSHSRITDTPGEAKAAKAADRTAVENKSRARSEAEQEIFLNDYCGNMPGAMQVQLQAGDMVLYRSIGWHLGSYVPYRKRATLHSAVATPEYEALWKRAEALAKA